MSCEPLKIIGPRGQKLYPSPMDKPGKYPTIWPLQRDIKRSISQYDHAEKVTICAQISARIPALDAAIRQKNGWSYPPQSWHPIFHGDFGDRDVWSDGTTQWLSYQVFPNALLGNSSKDLLKSIRVSGMDADRHGRDLAIFKCDASTGFMPKMIVVPGTRIGNGLQSYGWWSSVMSDTYAYGSNLMSGYGICAGGEFDGYRIYNGIIHDDLDEPIAARVLGYKRDDKFNWIPAYEDFRLGFQHGTHLWSEYDWHGMGAPLPRMSAAIMKWLRKEEIDDLMLTALANASSKAVTYKLAPGTDAPTALGDNFDIVTHTDPVTGDKKEIFVEKMGDGSTTFVGATEELKGLQYDFPTQNVQDMTRGNLVECLNQYGWPCSFLDSANTGRAATRLDCEMANESINEKQEPGGERLHWFLKFAVACGITHGFIPPPPPGPLDMAYRWTFGTPKEISVDAGNDVTASLNRLRFGLTSQRLQSSRWGDVQKQVDKDLMREALKRVDMTDALIKHAASKGYVIDFWPATQWFYSISPNPMFQESAQADAGGDSTAKNPAIKTSPEK